MLRNFHYEPDFDATLAGTNPTVQSSTPTWRTALRKMCDAWCEGLAAHRQYEHLRSRGIPHERALREALGIGAVSASAAHAALMAAAMFRVKEPSAPQMTQLSRRKSDGINRCFDHAYSGC
jgi:hypothetical protein